MAEFDKSGSSDRRFALWIQKFRKGRRGGKGGEEKGICAPKDGFYGYFPIKFFLQNYQLKEGGGGDVDSSPKSSLMITTVRREVDQTLK